MPVVSKGCHIYSYDGEKTKRKMERQFGDALEIIEPSGLDEIKSSLENLSTVSSEKEGELITVSKGTLLYASNILAGTLSQREDMGINKGEMYVPLIL